MKNNTNPVIETFIVLLFVSFLVILPFSIVLSADISGNDFEEIKAKYEIELILASVISFLGSMGIFYYLIRNSCIKNTPILCEKTPIIKWNYDKEYWEKIKFPQFKKTVLLYLLKISLIWLPITSILIFLINTEELLFSMILFLFILIFTVPLIPFTLVKFIKNINNQLFQNDYEVKLYRKGLTINEVYFPYKHYSNNLTLMDIEEVNDSLKFIIKNKFYSRATLNGGDFGSEMIRTSHIYIPIPKCPEMSLKEIKKLLAVK